jgi:hypothetical protein
MLILTRPAVPESMIGFLHHATCMLHDTRESFLGAKITWMAAKGGACYAFLPPYRGGSFLHGAKKKKEKKKAAFFLACLKYLAACLLGG